MIQKKEKEIEGLQVLVTQWTARRSFKNKFYFARVLKPVLGKIGEALSSLPQGIDIRDISILDLDVSLLADAIGTLGETMSDDQFDTFVSKIFTQTWFDNQEFKDSNFDNIFSDNMMGFYKAVFFVLEVNYKGLFLAKNGTGKQLKDSQALSEKRQKKGSQKR